MTTVLSTPASPGDSPPKPGVDLGPAVALSCRECGHRIDLGPYYACTECFGPLEVAYEFALSRRRPPRRGSKPDPTTSGATRRCCRCPPDIAETRNMNPGSTKLIRADNLARELGMKTLWVKDDSGNPTHSFKDRVVAVALAAARELGFSVLACPSTGNLANAVAAAAARAGIRSVVLIPSNLEQQKILTTAAYGGTLVAVEGNYDDINRLAGADRRGAGGLGVRQRQRPALLRGGFQDPRLRGRRATRLAAAAAGGHPDRLRRAIGQGGQGFHRAGRARPGRADAVQGVRRAGDRLLPGLRRVQGRRGHGPPGAAGHHREVAGHRQSRRRPVRAGRHPPNRRRRRGCQRRRGRSTGSSCWPAPRASSPRPPAASPSRVLRKLLATGQLDPEAETVIFNTGDGLKTLDAIADVVGPTATIAPTLDAFEQAGLA